MKANLTLGMDRTLIEQAKREARRRGISVSRLVATYFERLERLRSDEGPADADLPPITRRLRGIAAGADLEERDTFGCMAETMRVVGDIVETSADCDLLSELPDRITIDPEQCSGRPCIRGMRIRVTDVIDLLADGLTVDQVLAELPDLEPEDIQAALRFASRRVGHAGTGA